MDTRRNPWPKWAWIVIVGLLLVIVIAVLVPRVGVGPGQSGSTNAPGTQNPARPATSVAGRRDSIARRTDDSRTKLPPEQVVAYKLTQFARKRHDIVRALAKRAKMEISDDVNRYFEAIESDRREEAHALFEALKARRQSDNSGDLVPFWRALVETDGAAEQARHWPAQKLLDYGNVVLGSLRSDMVYVGGTDPGCFIPTMLNETSEGEQHIVLTQNALADMSYLDYLRYLYGDRLNMLTPKDGQQGFQTYLADAQSRLTHDQQFPDEPKQVRPGEDVKMEGNRVQVSGQVAVMAINELLLKNLMSGNPNLSFALEESFSFKSTYPQAAPLGPIMELGVSNDRALTASTAAESVAYWESTSQQLLSDSTAAASADTLNAYAKMALAQANLFTDHALTTQAEQTFRVANQLAPASDEVVFSYTAFLAGQNRFAEAEQVANAALRLSPSDTQLQNLVEQLSKRTGQSR